MDPISIEKYLNETNNHLNRTVKLPRLEALSEPYQFGLVVLYSVTALVAFLGNSFALLVILYGKRTSEDLRKYLANLAIADLMLAIFSIPFTYADFMFGRWLFPLFLCPVVQFVTITSVFVSVYTLIAIGFGRFVCLLFTLTFYFDSNKERL